MIPLLRRPARLAGAAALLVLLATACQGAVGPPSTELPAAQEAAGSSEPLDACALLPAGQVEELIGPHDGGTLATAPNSDGGACVWENPDTYYSVSIDCGLTGTAVGGDLPPWEPALGPETPLGDGMREFGANSGTVEFVAGERDCTSQVVRSSSGGDLDAAVALAGQVRDQLG